MRVYNKALTYPSELFKQIMACKISPSRALLTRDSGAALLTSWEKNLVSSRYCEVQLFRAGKFPQGWEKLQLMSTSIKIIKKALVIVPR